MSNQIKIEKGNWTTIQNDIFKAEINGVKLRPEDWGLYVFMISLPDDWDFSVMGLTKVINAGRDKITKMLNNLIAAGFVKREQANEGSFGKVIYTILHNPLPPQPDFPHPEKPRPENPTQQNTNKQRKIDKLKDKGDKSPKILHDLDSSKKYKTENPKNHFLTNELINKKLLSNLDYDVQKYNVLFQELDYAYDYELVIKATRYLVDYILKQGVNNFKSVYAYFSSSIWDNLKILDKQFGGSNFSKAKYNGKRIIRDEPDWLKEFLDDIANM